MQIASSFPSWGGTELHLLNLSRELQKRGHSVVVACRPDGWVESKAREWKLETVNLSLAKQHDWKMLPAFRREMRERRIDVLHAHWNSDILVPGTAARLEGVPARILSRHVPHPFRSRVAGKLFSWLLYTRFVTVSESVRRVLIASGVPPNRVVTIHHGTNIDEFQATSRPPGEIRRELGIRDDELAVNLAGRMTPEKGHADLIDAAGLLQSSGLPLKFVFTGDGPEAAGLKNRIDSAGLTDRFIFTGYRSDMSDVLAAMDIVTVPSTWEEPCSAVVQQGMIMGKPVIGTRVGGTPEMIVEGKTGLLAQASYPADLAEAIRKLAADPKLRSEMGEAGRQRVTREFSLSGMVDKIEALYYAELSRGKSAIRPDTVLPTV